MRKYKLGRRALAAFGGVLVLAGAGTRGPALPQSRAAPTGANEVPAADPDGAGTATVRIDATLNTVCADLEVSGIGPATAAHIHRGAEGVNGPPVVNLDPPDGEGEDEEDCDDAGDTLTDEIRANPAGFYVNVHNAEFPEGAIRGQLMPVAD